LRWELHGARSQACSRSYPHVVWLREVRRERPCRLRSARDHLCHASKRSAYSSSPRATRQSCRSRGIRPRIQAPGSGASILTKSGGA
jgi:hypothetical protein